MKFNKILCILLISVMCLSISPINSLAEEIASSQNSTVPVKLNTLAADFKVTVPTVLPIDVAADGTVTTATNANIVNNSNGPVKLVSTKVEPINSWELASYDSNFQSYKAGVKKIGLNLFNTNVPVGSSVSVAGGTDLNINASDSLLIPYNAKVATQTTAINENPMNVIFTFGWNSAGDNSNDNPDNNSGLHANSYLSESKILTLRNLIGSITFSTESPEGKIGTDISEAGDGSVIAVINGQDAVVYADGGCLAPVDSSNLFSGYKASSMDLRGLDTSNTTIMSNMFGDCKYLTSLNLNNFDTSNVTDMSFMFTGLVKLISLNLNSFDTTNVTDMQSMFSSAKSISSLNVSNFNTSKVEDMNGMFYDCSALTTLDLSNFDTSNVTNMNGMFNSCISLTSLDLSSFNTSKVTDMGYMFYLCSNLTELNLESFYITSSTDVSGVFEECIKLATVYVATQPDAEKLNTSDNKPANVNIVVRI